MNGYKCDHVDDGSAGNDYDDGVVAITMIVEVKCGGGDVDDGDDGGVGDDSGYEVRWRW